MPTAVLVVTALFKAFVRIKNLRQNAGIHLSLYPSLVIIHIRLEKGLGCRSWALEWRREHERVDKIDRNLEKKYVFTTSVLVHS